MSDNQELFSQLRIKGDEKLKENLQIQHELQLLNMKLERNIKFLKHVNEVLLAEGEKPIGFTDSPGPISFGRPGNRKPEMPARKRQWDNKSINTIIATVLSTNPHTIFRYDDMALEIYKITSQAELKRVRTNLTIILQKGVRDGLWDRAERGRFTVKNATK